MRNVCNLGDSLIESVSIVFTSLLYLERLVYGSDGAAFLNSLAHLTAHLSAVVS